MWVVNLWIMILCLWKRRYRIQSSDIITSSVYIACNKDCANAWYAWSSDLLGHKNYRQQAKKCVINNDLNTQAPCNRNSTGSSSGKVKPSIRSRPGTRWKRATLQTESWLAKLGHMITRTYDNKTEAIARLLTTEERCEPLEVWAGLLYEVKHKREREQNQPSAVLAIHQSSQVGYYQPLQTGLQQL